MSAGVALAPSAWIVVTGLDGAGKTTLVRRLAAHFGAHAFRLPLHDFVRPALEKSGANAPFGDVHTDRLLFALDARLANYDIAAWRGAGRTLVSQRGWMDNFIFGAVQGVSHAESEALLRTSELERPTAQIFLLAEPRTAYGRIRDDPRADKYETPAFLEQQFAETSRFLARVAARAPELAAFHDAPTRVVDTTSLTEEEVFTIAIDYCARLGS
jgi:thymidylate kinase